MAEHRSRHISNVEASRTLATNVERNSIRPTLEPTYREIEPFHITGVGYSSNAVIVKTSKTNEGRRSRNRLGLDSELPFDKADKHVQQQCENDIGKEQEQHCQIRLGLGLGGHHNVRSWPTGRPNVNTRPEVSSINRRHTAVQTRNSDITVRTTRSSKQSQKSAALSFIHESNQNHKPQIDRRGQQTMSKVNVNNYGRVSNPARPVGISRGNDQSDTRDVQISNNTSSSENRTAQRHGSYTVIPPDPKKRSKISSQAEREANAFQSYKESQRVNYVKTTPQSVGGKKSEEDVQRQRQKELNESRYRTQMKRRQWEAEKKEREEAEYRAKKEKAREQAIRNQARKSERQDTWTVDHKRTNEMFLRKLEQKSYQNVTPSKDDCTMPLSEDNARSPDSNGPIGVEDH